MSATDLQVQACTNHILQRAVTQDDSDYVPKMMDHVMHCPHHSASQFMDVLLALHLSLIHI